MKFEDYPESLKKLRIEIGVKLFHVRDNNVLIMEDNPYKEIRFDRKLALDLCPDEDYIDDDLSTTPAIFARYGLLHALVIKMLAKVDYELDLVRGKVGLEMRKRAFKNPDIPPNKITQDLIDAMVMDAPSVIVLSDMKDELKYAAQRLRVIMEAVQMKQNSVIELGRKRNKEMGLYGHDVVKGEGPQRERQDMEAIKAYRAARE